MESIQNFLSENWLIALSTPIYIILIGLAVRLSNYQKRNYYSVKVARINCYLKVANAVLVFAFQATALILLAAISQCSSEDFNLTTDFRSSVFRPFISIWFFLPLTFFGCEPLEILLMNSICQIYGTIVHTRFIKKMPAWFDAIFVSPSHHRVHYASTILYLDKNVGMVLTIWDKLFETFEKVRYRLTVNVLKPYHLTHQVFHGWQQVLKDRTRPNNSWRDSINYLVAPPSWSHDGSTLTAKELIKNLK